MKHRLIVGAAIAILWMLTPVAAETQSNLENVEKPTEAQQRAIERLRKLEEEERESEEEKREREAEERMRAPERAEEERKRAAERAEAIRHEIDYKTALSIRVREFELMILRSNFPCAQLTRVAYLGYTPRGEFYVLTCRGNPPFENSRYRYEVRMSDKIPIDVQPWF